MSINIIAAVDAGWSSLVARRAHNPKVVGSNPAPATSFPAMDLSISDTGSECYDLVITGFFVIWTFEISSFDDVVLGFRPFFVFRGVTLATLESKLEQMLIAPVEALGHSLWGIEFIQAGKHSVLRVYIDNEKGIFIDDCADVSRQVSAVLDVEDPISTEYTLEVSSPGVDRPLFNAAQYALYIGETVKVQLTMPVAGSRNLKGTVKGVEGQMLTLTVDGNELIIALDNIRKGNLIAKF